MKRRLRERVRATIEDQGYFRTGERVGVAVSGGADSVALLLLLQDLHCELGIVPSVVHFNHKLRGRASDADERAVRKLADRLALPFYSGQDDLASRAKREKANLEDVGRRARYSFFAQIAEKEHLDKIAVAHTADDQAETVLAHILRGTGLAGLGGIHPLVGKVVRPLLEFRRSELRAYLRSKKQVWREDATNRDTTRMRARIRRKLLPLLEREFQPKCVEHLAGLAELARKDEAFLSGVASSRMEECAIFNENSARISIVDVLSAGLEAEGTYSAASANRAIAERVVRLMVKKAKSRAGQLGAEHIQQVLRLATHGANGKTLQLPGGVRIRRERDELVFAAVREHRVNAEFKHAVTIDREETRVSVPELGCVFRFRVIDWTRERGDTIEKEFVLDRDALRTPLLLRNWRAGDRFRPMGRRNTHKVKRLLSEKHVGGWERNAWPVLTSDGAIVWARGLPVATEFAANERTRRGLVIVEERAS